MNKTGTNALITSRTGIHACRARAWEAEKANESRSMSRLRTERFTRFYEHGGWRMVHTIHTIWPMRENRANKLHRCCTSILKSIWSSIGHRSLLVLKIPLILLFIRVLCTVLWSLAVRIWCSSVQYQGYSILEKKLCSFRGAPTNS